MRLQSNRTSRLGLVALAAIAACTLLAVVRCQLTAKQDRKQAHERRNLLNFRQYKQLFKKS